MRRYAERIKRLEERVRLTALLKRDDPDGGAALTAYLQTMTPPQANEILASVMDDPPGRDPNRPGFGMILLFEAIVGPTLLLALMALSPGVAITVLLIFGVLNLVGAFLSVSERRGKTLISLRAAWELALRGDDHALSVLIDAWISDLPEDPPRADATTTEEALDTLLMSVTGRDDGGRSLARPARAYRALKRLIRSVVGIPPWRRAPDLSERQTDMVIAALLLLTRSATAGDRSLLRRVAKMPGTGENRALLREVAAQLLDPSTAAEITAARIAERSIPFQATTDALTKLPPAEPLQHVGRRL